MLNVLKAYTMMNNFDAGQFINKSDTLQQKIRHRIWGLDLSFSR